MQSNPRILKSEKNDRQIFAAFQNQTQRDIDVIWIDYQGVYRLYVTIVPQQVIHVNTFVHHAFVFEDTNNRDRMLVDGKAYFYAESFYMQFCVVDQQITRVVLPVRLPLHSLKTLALFAVRDMLCDDDDIDNLDIPMSIKTELISLLNLKLLPLHLPR